MQHLGHWPVGLIYHKYLASKKHFDTLRDLKKGLIIRNVIKVISFFEVELVCNCVFRLATPFFEYFL